MSASLALWILTGLEEEEDEVVVVESVAEEEVSLDGFFLGGRLGGWLAAGGTVLVVLVISSSSTVRRMRGSGQWSGRKEGAFGLGSRSMNCVTTSHRPGRNSTAERYINRSTSSYRLPNDPITNQTRVEMAWKRPKRIQDEPNP